jgi:hypothetical protein
MCEHRMIQGDNYGETCMECGEVLSGYGFWAEGSRDCHHKFVPSGEDGYEVCPYCETEALPDNKQLPDNYRCLVDYRAKPETEQRIDETNRTK